MKAAPYFNMKDRSSFGRESGVMSIPSWNRLMSGTKGLNDTVWNTLLIRLKEPKNSDH